MSKQEAEALGYAVIEASPSVWGLVCHGKGIRTWWKTSFRHPFHSEWNTPPALDDMTVMQAIEIDQQMKGTNEKKT